MRSPAGMWNGEILSFGVTLMQRRILAISRAWLSRDMPIDTAFKRLIRLVKVLLHRFLPPHANELFPTQESGYANHAGGKHVGYHSGRNHVSTGQADQKSAENEDCVASERRPAGRILVLFRLLHHRMDCGHFSNPLTLSSTRPASWRTGRGEICRRVGRTRFGVKRSQAIRAIGNELPPRIDRR